MKSIKFIVSNIPKLFRWLILTGFIGPILVHVVTQFLMNQSINFSINNIIILSSIIIFISLSGFIIGAIRSVTILRAKNNRSPNSTENISTDDKEKLKVLPYSYVKIGEYSTDNLSADILAKIILGENTKPDISLFLERINIDRPYCPRCSRPLDYWNASWMADGGQIGYKCLKCDTQREGDKYSVLNDAKAEVRKDFDNYWEIYENKIFQLTDGEPQKYKLP